MRVLLLAVLLAPVAAFAQDDSWREALSPSSQMAPELREEIVRIPLVKATADEKAFPLVGTLYQPQGTGPFPVIVLNHGAPLTRRDRDAMGRYRLIPQTRELVTRGFAVLVPMRRGYGASPGDMVEGTGSCDQPRFTQGGAEAARDVVSAVEFVRTRPSLDAQRIVLMGQSAGGFAVLTALAQAPQGVVAGINFAGGRGGAGRDGTHCAQDAMAQAVGTFAATTRVPVLWHYSENDKYFGPAASRAWFAAFQAAGAKGKLVMQPPFGNDGHLVFYKPEGVPLWTAAMDSFFREFGLEGLAKK